MLVGDSQTQQGVCIERSPVAWVIPQAAYALARVEDEAVITLRPRLRRGKLTHAPLHAVAIHDNVWKLVILRPSV